MDPSPAEVLADQSAGTSANSQSEARLRRIERYVAPVASVHQPSAPSSHGSKGMRLESRSVGTSTAARDMRFATKSAEKLASHFHWPFVRSPLLFHESSKLTVPDVGYVFPAPVRSASDRFSSFGIACATLRRASVQSSPAFALCSVYPLPEDASPDAGPAKRKEVSPCISEK